MSDAQAELEKALLTTYYANLLFLSRYDKKLYERIDALSKSIDNEKYEERYVLEFIKEEGEFDIYDIKHEKFLYDKQPKKFIKKALSKVHSDTHGSFSIFDKIIYTNEYSHIEVKDTVDQFEDASSYLLKEISEYTEIIDDDLSTYKEQKLKSINKFMFVGTLLGRHIIEIVKKLKPKNFFVCEHNLEIFRLSLFVFDYTLLVEDGNTVVFSIMDEDHEFKRNYEIFLKNEPYYNYSIKYYTTDYNVKDYFNPILDGLLGQKSTAFNHHMMLKNVAKLDLERVNKYNILQVMNSQNKPSILKDKPVLYVGAGPSLTENMDWIKENKDRFIIVAMGASYKRLLSNGITADVVTTLDPEFKILNEEHFDDESLEKIPEALIFASTNTNDKILKKFKKENVFLYEVVFPLHHTNIVSHGYSVGEIIGTLLIQLGCSEIYLVGIDLALNQETGETHISGYESVKTFDIETEIESSMDKGKFSLRDDLIEVKGNFSDIVLTTRLFSTSLGSFSQNLSDMKAEDQNVYNLSEHGAYITATIPKRTESILVDELSLLDKSKMKEELNKYLLSISKSKLEQFDVDIIQKEYNYLEKIRQELLNPEHKIKTFDDFWKINKPLILKFLEPKIATTFTGAIFTFYFNSILPYIFYHFNQKKLKKEKVKINEVEKVLYTQLIDIIEQYKKYMEIVLK